MDEQLRYPTGRFILPDADTAAANRITYLKAIGDLPDQLKQAVKDLTDKQLLDNAYRPGGWTARQVIHHLADSHVNAYVRHKRLLTEDHPTITPYDEVRWAELPDVTAVPVNVSVEMLHALHLRWATMLATCSDAQWERTGYHGGQQRTVRLDQLAAQYAWHGGHHLGHLAIVISKG